MEEEKKEISVKLTYQEFKNIEKLFPFKIRKTCLITIFVITLLFILLIIDPEDLVIEDIVFAYVFLIMTSYLIIKIIHILTRRLRYRKFFKNNQDKIDYTLEINKDNLIKKSKKEVKIIFYSDIKRYKYKNDTLYLFVDKEEIIPIKTSLLSKEEITSIKISIKKPKNQNNDLNIKDYIKEQDKKNPKIKKLLLILLIASILSTFMSLLIILLLVELNDISIPYLGLEYAPFALLLMPITIASVIMGIKYRNEGYKCSKNVNIGIASSIILLLISSTYFIYLDDRVSYDNLSVYEYAIKEKIPTKGKLIEINWDESYLQDHKTHYGKFTNKKEANTFYENLKKNKNWIKREEVSVSFASIVNDLLICEKDVDCLYLFYTDGVHIINKLPDKDGSFYAHFMMYNPKSRVLTIEHFRYNNLRTNNKYYNEIDDYIKDDKNTSEL